MPDVRVVTYPDAVHAFLVAEGTKVLTVAALKVVNRAKVLCPVDTGRLRDSITWELGTVGGLPAARIGTNVEYASYVETGTRYMAAQPFLRPALVSLQQGGLT